jgi:hypothetical protein
LRAHIRQLLPCAPGVDLLLTDAGAFDIVDGKLHDLGLNIQRADRDRGGTGRAWIVTWHRDTQRNGVGYFDASSRRVVILENIDQVPERVDTIQALDSGRALVSGMSRLRWWGVVQVHADGRAEFRMLQDSQGLNDFLKASGQTLDHWFIDQGRFGSFPDGSRVIVTFNRPRQVVLMDSRTGALELAESQQRLPDVYRQDFDDQPLYYEDEGMKRRSTVMRMSVDPLGFTPIATFGPRHQFVVHDGAVYAYDYGLIHAAGIEGPFRILRGPQLRDTPLSGIVTAASSENFGLLLFGSQVIMSVQLHDPPIPAQPGGN